MSSFMTIAGPKIDISDLKPIELIEASKAQKYIRDLEEELITEDGSPIYLIHDGYTLTSDRFVGDAWNKLQERGTVEGTKLLDFIKRLIANGNNFRIWYANNEPKAYLNAVNCTSLEEILQVISEQGSKIQEIEIRYLANKSVHTDTE